MSDAILSAQQSLIASGLINLVVLDQAGGIIAAEGRQVGGFPVGESIFEHLFVLAGLEDVIAAMARDDGAGLAPLELPAVFLGGNHEDGEPGVSLRLSPLDAGRVLLLIRPLESAGARDQISVQQHNDLALLRGQMDSAQSQAELNIRAREQLFDALRWGFKAPLVTLVQGFDDTEAATTASMATATATATDAASKPVPAGGAAARQRALAQQALDAVDDWLHLLALRSEDQGAEPANAGQALSLPALVAWIEAETGLAAALGQPVPQPQQPLNQGTTGTPDTPGKLVLRGSASILQVGLKALIQACEGDLCLSVEAEADAGAEAEGGGGGRSLKWMLEGVRNGPELDRDHRFELARTTALHFGGSLAVKDQSVTLQVPLG